MKIPNSETIQTAAEDSPKGKSRLELRRRPVASLTEEQMEGAVGGHPHTCEPTCPETCCPTCGHTCHDTCVSCATCDATCNPAVSCDPRICEV